MADDRLQRALVGRYEIGETIGRGGMASVLVARDPRHQRDVAIKVLDPSDAPRDARSRFLREIRVTAGLTHPGIVPIFDSGDAEGLLYYVMPLLPGETLAKRMANQPLSPTDACALVADVADALDLAHRHGVVHRDVKPENILLVETRPVLTDFGVAYVSEADTKTQTGVMVGTLLYMSPEQLSGDRPVDARADIYALGCVLYELLFGAAPHASATVPQLLTRRATQPVTIPDVPPAIAGVRGVLQRALEREPDRRYRSAAELATALRHSITLPVAVGSRRRVQWAVAAIVAIAVIGTAALMIPRRDVDASIAVLPFTNSSGVRDLDYVADGVSDELLSAISDISGVRALSPTVAAAVQPASLAPARVAQQLGVAFVLDGSARKNADSVRVYARLVDRTGAIRWSRSFDGTLADLFHMQEEIAQAVASNLRIRFSQNQQIVRSRTASPVVHDLVLRALHLQKSEGRDSQLRGLATADSAIALDSSYAPAWAVRARSLTSIAVWADSAGFDVLRAARDAAVHAVQLDSMSAEAHTVVGQEIFRYDWDWREAESHFRRAIALNPSLAIAHSSYSRMLRSLGRFDEARTQYKTAAALDPTISPALTQARISYFAHDFERSFREFQLATRNDSAVRAWVIWTAQTLVGLGRFAQAESLLSLPDRGEPTRPATRVVVYARTGRLDLARRLADSLVRDPTVSPDRKAVALTAIGERQRALDEIERAVATHSAFVVDFKVDPLLDSLHNEPRFQAVLKKLRFP